MSNSAPSTGPERTANASLATEPGDVSQRPSIWQLALPSILGNLSYTIVGMVQTKFVGELGPQALAAVGAGQRVMFAMLAILMAVSAGTTALVARAWGAGDYEEASRVTMASLVLAGSMAAVVAVLGFLFAGSMAGVFGLDEETLAMATRNIRWLSFFNIAFAGMLILSAALRASGDAWSPLWISAGINVLNLPLLYAFIFGRWGMPEMGVAGAAVAAGIAFSLGTLVLLTLWVRQKFRVRHVTGGWWRRQRLKQLLNIGYPAALEQGVFQLGFFIFLILIGNNYGTEAFAAYNIGVNILAICMTVGFGFSIAGSTLVGQHLGAKDFAGAVRSGWRAMFLAIVSMGLIGLAVMVFAEALATYFIGDGELTIAYTVQFIYVLGAMMPLLAVEFAIGGALRGAGDTRFPLIATILGLLVMRCGLAAVAAYFGLPVIWVFAALIGDYVLKGAMLIWRFRQGRWKTIIPEHPAY
ncbi:MAG: MATE family efflux transporter [Pseudomonadales bacterium]|nr:MATE family efflux transporter [Pseudomonadales bacterium]